MYVHICGGQRLITGVLHISLHTIFGDRSFIEPGTHQFQSLRILFPHAPLSDERWVPLLQLSVWALGIQTGPHACAPGTLPPEPPPLPLLRVHLSQDPPQL